MGSAFKVSVSKGDCMRREPRSRRGDWRPRCRAVDRGPYGSGRCRLGMAHRQRSGGRGGLAHRRQATSTVELAATDLELFVAVTEEFSARRRAGSGHPGARRVPHGLQHPQQAGAVPPPRSASHGLSRSRSRDATTPLGGGLLARLWPTMFSERLRAISREARCWRHRRSRGVTVPKERSDAGFAERRAGRYGIPVAATS